ncbi:hypothetical protein CDL15_Pgr016839 [Punica granatum]|uniref:Uncharacterized protein n=1 Tax=Punica granatum TaxID=22663 RepID=A0A218WZE6_PUNGR|nr:hypothetical protein CDL15_Pgr016839 [Punica granatum]
MTMSSVMLVAMLVAKWFTIPSSAVKRAGLSNLDVVCAVGGGCPIGTPECAVNMSVVVFENVSALVKYLVHEWRVVDLLPSLRVHELDIDGTSVVSTLPV